MDTVSLKRTHCSILRRPPQASLLNESLPAALCNQRLAIGIECFLGSIQAGKQHRKTIAAGHLLCTFRECIFQKVKSVDDSTENVPFYLNAYDLTPANGYSYWAGLGVFHAGVDSLNNFQNYYFSVQTTLVYGVEYSFGAHDCPTSGVFEVEPRQCPGFKFRKTIFMGTTNLSSFKMREFMKHQSANYHGNTYHLIVKNCNHFCADIRQRLTGNLIPKWVNRLARLGSLCNCLLSDALKTSTSREDANFQGRDSKKKKLRATFSCLLSMSGPRRSSRGKNPSYH